MSTTSPIKNWSHPFKPSGSDLDPLQVLTAMAKASSGFYPIGKNGQWHGGIHFDANTARVFDQSSVRCIADGEVIAYRIDANYPQSRYLDERNRPRNAPFSTGFVLVKHRLEAPPLPGGADTPPALTFYSLYMHLLDWGGYNKPGAPTPPEFISETLYKVKPDKATDPLVGLRVRSEPGGTVLALLPKGCKVKVGQAHSVKPKWRKLVSILQGCALPAINSPDLGWVFTEEMQPTSESDQFLVGEDANDPEPALAPAKGLNVRKTGRGDAPKTGLLPLGTAFSLESDTGAYRKLKAIIEGHDIAPLSANSVRNIQGYVHFESLQATRATPKLDQVHILASPQPIKAGDLIGHIGQYQNHDDASPQQMLHLEVFSCEDVPRFITKSRAWAASLPAEQKSLLKIHKGASKLIFHQERFSASNPPKLNDAGITVGIDLIIPQILLDKLPADRKLQVSTLMPGNNNQITYWWRLENLLADASGNPISGWLAEQETITTRHSPWEWVGYDFIQETGRPIGKAAYLFDALRRLTEKERANYRALVNQEDHGPVRARLYDIIDSNHDNNLTSDEIRNALKRPWHAQSIAQLITRYESEWLLNKEKWDELDPLMGHVPIVDPNHNWVSEKQRIEKLSWWGALAGKQGISTDGKAWHFQPIIILNLSMQTSQLINVERFIEKYVASHTNFIAGAPAFSETSKSNLRKVVEHINIYYNGKHHQANLYELSYMFATARHEAWHFLSSEYFSTKPEIGNLAYFNKYDPVLASTQSLRTRAIENENTLEGDGFKYRGRGLVHLTWKRNYRKAKEHFGVDFVENPDKAAEFEHSIPIMIWGMKTGIFTGHKLSNHINSSQINYTSARKIINGTDQQALIAEYAQKFEAILRETSVAQETFTP
jgi:hypothetical protein